MNQRRPWRGRGAHELLRELDVALAAVADEDEVRL